MARPHRAYFQDFLLFGLEPGGGRVKDVGKTSHIYTFYSTSTTSNASQTDCMLSRVFI